MGTQKHNNSNQIIQMVCGNVMIINSLSEFQTQISSGKPIVVDFTATWCPPCQRIAPKFEQMSIDNPDLVFLKVDVDAQQEVAIQSQIEAMPTFHFYKGGSKVDELVGASEAELRAKIAKLK